MGIYLVIPFIKESSKEHLLRIQINILKMDIKGSLDFSTNILKTFVNIFFYKKGLLCDFQ